MEKDFLHIEQLDAYRLGILPPDERRAFEQRLENDPELRAVFEAYSDMLGGIRTAGDLELLLLIREAHTTAKAAGLTDAAHSEAAKPAGKVVSLHRNTLLRRIAAAASVLILAAVGLWWYFQPSPYDQAFATHYTPEKNRLGQALDQLEARGIGTPDNPAAKLLRDALQAYERGDMPGARSRLESYASQFGLQNHTARFYLGVTLLAEGDFPKAAETLIPLATNPAGGWQGEARFYLALTYCKIPSKHAEAKQLFEEIAADPGSPFQGAAQAILPSL